MTLDVDSRIALDEVYRRSFEAKNKKIESIPSYFLDEMVQRLKEKLPQDFTPEEKKKMEKGVRLDVYQGICSSKVDSRIFLSHIQSTLNSPERLFHFRRAFAGQLAANSLFQYVFSVAERTPQRFVILQSNARVLSPDFRVSYTNQGKGSLVSRFVSSDFVCLFLFTRRCFLDFVL